MGEAEDADLGLIGYGEDESGVVYDVKAFLDPGGVDGRLSLGRRIQLIRKGSDEPETPRTWHHLFAGTGRSLPGRGTRFAPRVCLSARGVMISQ